MNWRSEFAETALYSNVFAYSIIQTVIAPIWEIGSCQPAKKKVPRRPERLQEFELMPQIRSLVMNGFSSSLTVLCRFQQRSQVLNDLQIANMTRGIKLKILSAFSGDEMFLVLELFMGTVALTAKAKAISR